MTQPSRIDCRLISLSRDARVARRHSGGVTDPAPDPPESLARPENTARLARGVQRFWAELGYAPLLEMPLANGRRADVVALGPKGEIVITEIKSGLADYAADGKWPDYLDFCDRFFFAVDADFPHVLIPDEVGLIVADGFGGEIVRAAPETPLAPARRKAMTLAFARLAAARLFSA